MDEISVLYIEDDVQDYELVVRRLKAEGINFSAKRVDTRSNVLEALERRKFDVILCDFSLPGYDGTSALSESKRAQPETPFIFVSGTIGEIKAIEAIKQGATDYVLKTDLNRLVPSMKRALREAEERRLRRVAEEEAREREKKFRLIFEFSPIGILNLDPKGTFLACNPAAEQILGYSEKELREKSFNDITHPADKSIGTALMQDLISGKRDSVALQKRYVRKTGSIVWANVMASAVRDPEGHLLYTVSMIEDITERKLTDEALRTSEERYRTLFETMDEGFCVIEMLYDSDGEPFDYRFLEINPAFEKQTGLQQALGKTVRELVPNLESHWFENYGNVARTGEAVRFENMATPLRRYYDVFAFRLGGDGSQRVGVLFNDITERKRAEDKLREHAALLDVNPAAIMVKDMEDHITFWNLASEHLYGWAKEDVLGTKSIDLIQRELLDQYREANRVVVEKNDWQSEWIRQTKDGKHITVGTRWALIRDAQGDPISVYVVDSDISERKKLEAQLLRSQRMESIGTLAGGIAHDLNNILSPILLVIEFLRKKYPLESDRGILDTLETSAKRGAEIVKQVLTFARGVEGTRTVIEPEHLLPEFEKIVKNTFPKSIHITTLISNDLWRTMGDPTQLYQVLMNLGVNARDAMPKGGRLNIEMKNILIDEQYAGMHVDAKQGPYISISVSDTGTGIPPEIIGRIFEPFFTTRELGKGTGLGLSTVVGIVKSHGGFVNVYSEVGKGTTFKVYLPAVETNDTRTSRREQSDMPAGNGELVLLVDDEAAIRQITKVTLESYGYQVLVANDGMEGVALYAQHKSKIELVLTDMMMPSMDGPTMIRVLQKMSPDVKLIAVSGLANNIEAFRAAELNSITFLQKPYTAGTLLSTLRQVLDKNV